MIAALLLSAASPTEYCAAPKKGADAGKYRAACEVLAAERAFDALAHRKGQWTAFRETATADAEMFVPNRVNAQQWLSGKPDPKVSVRWQPHRVFTSCDGTTAVTTGAAQWPDGSHGRFMTIWQRQPDRGWKWVLDVGGPVREPKPAPAEPEIIAANCERGTPPRRAPLTPGKGGRSPDQSLTWHLDVDAAGKGLLATHGWNGRWYQQVTGDTMPFGSKP